MVRRQTVTFNGHELTKCALVENLVRPLPSWKVVAESGDWRDGEMWRAQRLEPLDVTFSLFVHDLEPTRRMEAVRAIAAAVAVSRPSKLQFADMGGLYWLAVPSGAPTVTKLGGTALSVGLSFHVPHPALWGVRRSVTVPSGGSVAFQVGGTYPTTPVIAASAAKRGTSNLWGVRLDGGDYLRVLMPTAAAQSVVLDCSPEARTCRVAGALALPTDDSDWFELAPGAHQLTMDVGTGAAEVSWIERWL